MVTGIICGIIGGIIGAVVVFFYIATKIFEG